MYRSCENSITNKVSFFDIILSTLILYYVVLYNEKLFSVTASAQKEDFKCPDDYGFYPHPVSCDKYWKCDNGLAELKTCGNGLAFEDTDPKYLKENCDYLHNVDCGDRTQLGE